MANAANRQQQARHMTPPTPEILRFGTEQEPVVVIDDFSTNANTLLGDARSQHYGSGGQHYPGHRAPAPRQYLSERRGRLNSVLSERFGMHAGARLIECSYSLITTPPHELTPIQRLPHFDTTERGWIALLHYLCPPEQGGTSFYRHRATGFEAITEARRSAYDDALHAEMREHGLPPARYFSGSTDQFERIGGVEACFNRMAIYRGRNLHSGDIRQPETAVFDPARARLTINSFLFLNGQSDG